MVADPKLGTIYARGIRSGMLYAVEVYDTDGSNGDLLTFDGGNGAGASSPNFYTFPEDVIVFDMSWNAGAAGTYQLTKFRLVGDGRPSASILRIKAHLETLNNRPPLAIKVRAGTRVTGVMLT